MADEPDILFHRYFQRPQISAKDRERYKGKKDLDTLAQPAERALFLDLQKVFNDDLGSVPGFRFYFDYVDATVENALAFRYGEYSFVGITMPLVHNLWDVCVRLSRSATLCTLLGVQPTTEDDFEKLHVLFFRQQLNFVVAHEFTHHFFGHTVPVEVDSIFFNEITEGRSKGDITAQAREADADGNAIYLLLTNLVDNDVGRDFAVQLLNLGEASRRAQNEMLFSCLVITAGAFFFVRPPVVVHPDTIYGLTHPPQAARMDRLMASAIRWCGQYNHPELATYMKPQERFRELMNAVASAVWGMNGGKDWGAQTAFLRSADGAVYMRKLDEAQKALKGN